MKQRLFLCFASGFDHFDTALYGFLAPILAPLFFATAPPLVALILSYSVLATGIIFRPLGVLIAYTLSRRLGMAVSLSFSLLLMAAAMLLMALLPTFQTAGLWAPLSLLGARSVLDVAAPWERSLSKLYLLDQTLPAGGLWWSSLYEGFSLAGLFLAALAAYGVQGNVLHWRTLFAMGAATALSCALLRLYGLQSSKCALPEAPRRALHLLWHQRTILAKVALAHAFSYGTYSAAFILPAALLPALGTLHWGTSFYSLSFLYGIDVLAVLTLGWTLRRYAPLHLLRLAAGILTVTFIPLFAGLVWGGLVYSLFVRIWIVIWGVVFAIALTPWARHQTDVSTPERTLVLGIGKVLGDSLVGRNLVALALACYGLFGHLGAAALPFALLGLMTFRSLTHRNTKMAQYNKTAAFCQK